MSIVRKLHVTKQSRCILERFLAKRIVVIFNEADNIRAKGNIAKLVIILVGFEEVIFSLTKPMELHEGVNHHVLRRGKTQLFGKEFRQYLGRSHPPESVKFVIALDNFIAFMKVLFMLRVFQEVNKPVVLHLV